MTDINSEEFKKVLRDVLHNERKVTDTEHKAHHDYVQMLIERDKKRAAMWEKFKLSFIGTVATGMVGGLIWLGKVVMDYVSRHPTGGS